MYTFKFVGLAHEDAETPYYYGSLPTKPELGHVLAFEPSGNRYVIHRIECDGLSGEATSNQRELAYAEIGRNEKVPTLFLQRVHADPATTPVGRSFDCDEVKGYSQHNREARLSAKGGK